MQIEVNRSSFAKAVGSVKNAILPNQDYMKVLSHYGICNGMVFGYNDTMLLATPMPELKKAPKMALPDILLPLVSKMTGKALKLNNSSGDGKVLITSGRSRATLAYLDGESFIFTPDNAKLKAKLVIPITKNIVDGIILCLKNINEDPTMSHQMGITLSVDASTLLSLYSTDNATVSRFITKLDKPTNGKGLRVILPKPFCTEVAKNGEGELRLSATAALYKNDNGFLAFTKLIEEKEKPNFKGLFTDSGKEKRIQTSGALANATARAALLMGADTPKSIEICCKNGYLEMKGASALGKIHERVKLTMKMAAPPNFVDVTNISRALTMCNHLHFRDDCLVFTTEDRCFTHLVETISE